MKKKHDLIVVGGGFAGICAAISAAKNGVDVLLIERYNALGGAAVHALVMPFMKYHTKVDNQKVNLCGSIFSEIVDEMNRFLNRNDTMIFDEEVLKLVLNRMAQKYGVNLLFNTTVTEVLAENGTITSVKALGKSAVLELSADYFIDATGDGELSMLAGCQYQLGRPKDELCQPMTLCFRMGGVDLKRFYENYKMMNPLYKAFQEKGLIKNPREDVLMFDNLNDGVLHFNSTRIVKKNPTDPFEVTQAEIEAREQVFELHKFLQENVPGFENARVLSTAIQIGIRESRKILGDYTLTEEDLLNLARFDDAIAVANYDIDIHNPEGKGTSHHYFKDGEWYQIPYRCLLPKGQNNLLVAGRCISATHEAQASLRIMPYCAEIGQAAGAAASVAKESKKSLREIDVKSLQTLLRKEDFIL